MKKIKAKLTELFHKLFSYQEDICSIDEDQEVQYCTLKAEDSLKGLSITKTEVSGDRLEGCVGSVYKMKDTLNEVLNPPKRNKKKKKNGTIK